MRPINDKTYNDLIILSYPKERMLKLSNGVNFKKFIGLKKTHHNGVNYGFVGRLTKIKNLNFLLDVFKSIFSEYPNDKLLIYGEGPEEESILDFIDQNNLVNNIIFIGYEKDKKKIYSNIDVLINSSYGEGISNVLLEAMSAKTLVIASKVQGNTDLIRHKETGLLYNINNKSDLLKQLKFHKENNKSVLKILDNAENEIRRKYDIDIIAKEIYDFLKYNL